MRLRPLPTVPAIRVSELGIGLWAWTSDMWPAVRPDDARRWLRRAFDRGVNYVQTGDAYTAGGRPGVAEEFLRGAGLPRDDLVIATTVGHEITRERHPVKGYPHFTDVLPEAEWGAYVRRACEASLERLGTDRIDIYQLHNPPSLAAVRSEEILAAFEGLEAEGKIRAHGLALGPANGWRDEGIEGLKRLRPASMMVIFSLFEPYPGEIFYWGARLAGAGMTARVSLASGMLAGYYRPGMDFPDHRAHRTKSDPRWIEKALRRCETLEFLTAGRTLAQAALRYTLDRFPDVAVSTVPTLYNDPEAPPMEDRIDEYTALSDVPVLTPDELARIEDLRRTKFGVPDEEMALKGVATIAEAEPEAVG